MFFLNSIFHPIYKGIENNLTLGNVKCFSISKMQDEPNAPNMKQFDYFFRYLLA